MTSRIIVTDGPYELTHAADVVAQEGNPREGLRATDLGGATDGSGTAWLCRCGQSTSKPACDGTHSDCTASSDNDQTAGLHTWPAGGSSPSLTFTTGSAIEIENIEVTLLDGSTVDMQGKAAVLCRCGQSGVKPGCDGTCREVGFEG